MRGSCVRGASDQPPPEDADRGGGSDAEHLARGAALAGGTGVRDAG